MIINRNTIQRTRILEYLRKVKTHPAAETVYKEVKKTIPTITLATVYRNLNLLTEQGIINRMTVNHEYRYDGESGVHQHAICKKCGKIIDVEFQTTIKPIKNFNTNTIFYYGTCDKCRGET
jgi:Fe2+ or Zn2+ uptake regulation protein